MNKLDKVPPDKSFNIDLLNNLVREYGYNTNSIYHLYGNIRHFYPSFGSVDPSLPRYAVGYQSQKRHNILLADPLCPPEMIYKVLESFIKFSKDQGKEVLLFGINKTTAIESKKLGFHFVKIGQEPIFDLQTYSSKDLPLKIQSAAKQVLKKGVVIEEYSINSIKSDRLIASLNEVLHLWFMSRNSDEFKLLTEVSPLSAAEDKKFFIARQGEHVEGFLACSPIYKRNGFFLHDLIRTPSTLNGVTEALIIKALETLKGQGYSMASLGISPLSGMSHDSLPTDFENLSLVLDKIYNRMVVPLNFKALSNFKNKFMPTSVEPAYLGVQNGRLTFREILAFLKILIEFNLIKEFLHLVNQWHSGLNIPKPLAWAIDPTKITLAPLANITYDSIIERLKFTLVMFFLNIFAFIYTTDSVNKINPRLLEQFGFSYQHFAEHQWFILVTSNFVHFDFSHLFFNMLSLLVITSSLELIGGTRLASIVYLVGCQANVPNGLILLPALKLMESHLFKETYSFLDVGASLGIMATFGGLVYFFKPKLKWGFLFAFTLVFLSYSIYYNELFGIDHVAAVYMGFFITRYYFGIKASQKVFEDSKFRYFDLHSHQQKLQEQQKILHNE